jgi:hypothetical protein
MLGLKIPSLCTSQALTRDSSHGHIINGYVVIPRKHSYFSAPCRLCVLAAASLCNTRMTHMASCDRKELTELTGITDIENSYFTEILLFLSQINLVL